MKLACNIRMIPGDTYSEKCQTIANFGFEGVELRFLESDLDAERVDDIEKAVTTSGIKAASIITVTKGFMVPLDSKENLDIKLASAQKSMELSARFKVGAFITPEYKPQTPLPLWDGPHLMTQSDEELLYHFMSEVADCAEKINGFALLEPINRYENHFYFRIQEVMALIDKVASNRLKIVVDFFHMNLEEANIAESILSGAGYISHVQLGDSNRQLPGNGHTDFVSGFAALHQIGYDGYMALECQVPKNPHEELPKCVRYLQGCIEEGKNTQLMKTTNGPII